MVNPEDFLEFIKNRRSIRSFQDKQVPDNEIQMILEAGRWGISNPGNFISLEIKKS